MADCPHCSKTIESLSGFVKQEVLTERLSGKDEAHAAALAAVKLEAKGYATELSTAREKATGFDALKAQFDELKAESSRFRQDTERTGILDGLGIDAEKMLPHFEMVFNAANAGATAENAKSFADWIASDAPANPLLTSYLSGSATDGGSSDGDSQVKAPVKPGLPTVVGAVVSPTGAPQKLTPGQAREYFASPAYLALPAPAQAAKRAEVFGLPAPLTPEP